MQKRGPHKQKKTQNRLPGIASKMERFFRPFLQRKTSKMKRFFYLLLQRNFPIPVYSIIIIDEKRERTCAKKSKNRLPVLRIKMLVRVATKIPFPRSKLKENDGEIEKLFCRALTFWCSKSRIPNFEI